MQTGQQIYVEIKDIANNKIMSYRFLCNIHKKQISHLLTKSLMKNFIFCAVVLLEIRYYFNNFDIFDSMQPVTARLCTSQLQEGQTRKQTTLNR